MSSIRAFPALPHLTRMAALLAGLGAAGFVHALALPAVSPCGYGTGQLLCTSPVEGVSIHVASQNDDFVVYSVNALTQLASDYGYAALADWASLPSFGSGQIVKMFSFNSSNNQGFPPATGGTGDNGKPGDQTGSHDGAYLGDWPNGQDITVGALQSFLGSDTPVFSFDLNNNANLYLNGVFEVRRNGSAVEVFALDGLGNNSYDADSWVLTETATTVEWLDPNNTACDSTGLCTMQVRNNIGSGKPDFFTYVPALSLSNYLPTDTVHFRLRMAGLDAGGEELALNKMVTPPVTPPNPVPEPGLLALLGLGLLGLTRMRRA